MSLSKLAAKEVLSIDEIERFGDRLFTFVNDRKVSPEERTRLFAEWTGGQVYTQIDGDCSDAVFYDKGWHLVNRTGVYAVVVPVGAELAAIEAAAKLAG